MKESTTMATKQPCLFSLLFLATFWVARPVGCVAAANLRATSSAYPREVTTVPDTDLVSTSSYLVVQVEGYGMDDLARISREKQAIIDCAFHEAFDKVHGNRDGLYLSGQQIVATDLASGNEPEAGGDDRGDAAVGFRKKYVYRPRKFPPKHRPRPTYPPPKPPPKQYEIPNKWNIYWHMDMSGKCNMCPDDDSMQAAPLLLTTDNIPTKTEELALVSKQDRDRQIATNYVMSESSVNAIADALRTKLIEGVCAIEGHKDDSFEYVRDTDIFVLSQSDFEDSVAVIVASREPGRDTQAASAAVAEAKPSESVFQSLPFYYGGASASSILATTATNEFFKIGLSGVDCGPWNNEAVLDLNSGLHDSINSMGFMDKGHVMDKIVGGRNRERSDRRFAWKCHYDVYARLDIAGGVVDDASLDDIGDALCDDLIQYGGNEKFRNVIDCQLEPKTASEYAAIVAATDDKKAGLPISPARE